MMLGGVPGEAELGGAGGDPADVFGGGHVGLDVDDGGPDEAVGGGLEVEDLGAVGSPCLCWSKRSQQQ
jgi:hypothetical protein